MRQEVQSTRALLRKRKSRTFEETAPCKKKDPGKEVLLQEVKKPVRRDGHTTSREKKDEDHIPSVSGGRRDINFKKKSLIEKRSNSEQFVRGTASSRELSFRRSEPLGKKETLKSLFSENVTDFSIKICKRKGEAGS